jgi:AraC-like DNA-binding protein
MPKRKSARPIITPIRTVHDYCRELGAKPVHPHVGIVHYDELGKGRHILARFEIYGFFMRNDKNESLVYGAGAYRYRPGSIISVSPGQVGGMADNGETFSMKGYALLVDKFFWNRHFRGIAHRFKFLDYARNEAIQTSKAEQGTIAECMEKIRGELAQRDSDEIIAAYIRLLLAYFDRASRHMEESPNEQQGILVRFDKALANHYQQTPDTLPTVGSVARELCLSAGYLGELVKEASGIRAVDYIARFVVNKGIEFLMSGKNVSETAEALGFKYVQHFCRTFHNVEGTSPKQFIKKM